MPQTQHGTSSRETAIALSPALLLLALALASVGCKSHSAPPAAASAPQPRSSMAQTVAVHAAAPRLICPPLDSSAASASSTKGGHRVVLSWNASSRDAKHGTAIGYCLYRATAPNKRATEQVNVVPLPGTKCVDDVVENGKKYSYVVRAISALGNTSLVSKPAPVMIPDSPPSAPPNVSSPAASAPMCREPQPAQ